MTRKLWLSAETRKGLAELGVKVAKEGDKVAEERAKGIIESGQFQFAGDYSPHPSCAWLPDSVEVPMLRIAHYLGHPGVWITWILVSLGAPFWLETIRKLVGFRDLVARKEEQAREKREGDQRSP
jgi:hypothetical protein